MTKPLNKKRAAALIEQAQLSGQKGDWKACAEAARTVAYGSAWSEPHGFNLLAEALAQLEQTDELVKVLEDGLEKFPGDGELLARLGTVRLQREEIDAALDAFRRARPQLKRDPGFLTHSALALLKADKLQAAEADLAVALLSGGGLDTKLVMALAKAKRGRYDDAKALAQQVEAEAPEGALRWGARAVLAESALMQGDAPEAMARWKALEAEGHFDEAQLGHLAWAAELAGESELADDAMTRCQARGPDAEDLLLFARIDNLRQRPTQALEHLNASVKARGAHQPGFDVEIAAARGRALRLAGRAPEAKAVLVAALALPEAADPRLGPQLRVDLGHLAAEAGDFEAAQGFFDEALKLDPNDPEAKRALWLTNRKVAWREELKASTQAQVEAAQSEAEAFKRRFLSREGELDALKREVDRLKQLAKSAEARAQAVTSEAQAAEARAKLEAQRKLREELEARELDVDAKTAANLELALGETAARCPPALTQALEVAERTYQTALYTELPAAAVAVLYSGALERSLLFFFVARFDAWLDATGRREAFLTGATKELRAGKREYYENFTQSFDRERSRRPPGMGEVSRVLERRADSHLLAFGDFLKESYGVADAFFGAAADFVEWAKQKLRDPVAHGQGIELGWDELKQLREQLLFSFAGGEGFLKTLLGSMRDEA